MIDRFSRTRLLLGDEGVEKLQKAKVAVFGVGGVGGFAAEALARTGVGTLEIIDSDTVSLTNLNRQLIALESTIGQKKVEVLKRRLLDINPEINVIARDEFFLPENSESFDFLSYDYVVDAIDTVSGKIELVMKAKEAGTPIICSMGAGNKLDPTRFEVADIFSTSVCPLARVMRTELRKRGVKKLKVVYSKEPAQKPRESEEQSGKRQTPGSLAFVPSVAGLIIASEVVKDIVGY